MDEITHAVAIPHYDDLDEYGCHRVSYTSISLRDPLEAIKVLESVLQVDEGHYGLEQIEALRTLFLYSRELAISYAIKATEIFSSEDSNDSDVETAAALELLVDYSTEEAIKAARRLAKDGSSYVRTMVFWILDEFVPDEASLLRKQRQRDNLVEKVGAYCVCPACQCGFKKRSPLQTFCYPRVFIPRCRGRDDKPPKRRPLQIK